MIAPNRTALISSAIASIALLGTAALSQPVATPSIQKVKQLFTASFVDNSYPSRRESLQIESMTCGAPRRGNWYTDGIPAGTNTMVVACKIAWNKTALYSDFPALNTITKTTGRYVFFNDDVGVYTFRAGASTQFQCNLSGGNCRKF